MLDGHGIQAAARAAVGLLLKKCADSHLESVDSETAAYVELCVNSDEFRQIADAKIAERSQYREMV